MRRDVVVTFEAASLLPVGEEFALTRAARRARLAWAAKHPAQLDPHGAAPSTERPWPGGCNTCSRLAHRVPERFTHCPECGLERTDS